MNITSRCGSSWPNNQRPTTLSELSYLTCHGRTGRGQLAWTLPLGVETNGDTQQMQVYSHWKSCWAGCGKGSLIRDKFCCWLGLLGPFPWIKETCGSWVCLLGNRWAVGSVILGDTQRSKPTSCSGAQEEQMLTSLPNSLEVHACGFINSFFS